MNEFLDRVYWGNTVLHYLIAAGSILVCWVILKLVKKKVIGVLTRLTARTSTIFDDMLVKGAEKFAIPYIYLLANYSILTQLNLHPKLERTLSAALAVVTAYYIIRLLNYVLHAGVVAYMEARNERPERIKQLNGILLVVKVMTWLLGIMMLIDNLGYDITALVTGLGVGGIAIALAAQNILGDLFSYLVIFFDKPFEIGDFIKVGSDSGVVEKIGIKTSHVRSLDGQILVIPNAEMVKTVINNYKRLERRRVILTIGVTYETDPASLRKITGMIKAIIEKQEMVSFDRAHFKAFGDFSLNFEVVYYIDSPDYLIFMNAQEAIGLAIFDAFADARIDFAYPTQTLYVNRQGEEPAPLPAKENKEV